MRPIGFRRRRARLLDAIAATATVAAMVAMPAVAGAARLAAAMQHMSAGLGLVPEQAWEDPDYPASPYGSDRRRPRSASRTERRRDPPHR